MSCEPTETAVRLWRMHGDCAANHIRYNGNDVVNCFVINFILRIHEWWKGNGSARHFRKSVRKSAKCGLKVLVCGFANRFLSANFCGFAVKKLKSTTNPQFNNITVIVSAICKKIRIYNSRYRQIWVDVFLMYNTLSPSSSAVERLFPRGAAILTAKRVGLRSRNF